MHNVVLVQIKQPFIDAVDNLTDIFFFQKFVPKYDFLQVPTVIEVSDDVAVVFALKNVSASDHVFMVEFLQDGSLIKD